MPAEMSIEERLATFAARQHTLSYLIKVLEEQIGSQSLNSLLLTGPRGAGKTTLVLMLLHAIETQKNLGDAWLPVHFSEELPAVTSLRDLMSEALHVLAEADVLDASEWYDKCEKLECDDQSLEVATTGLREIARSQNRRLVFFVENLDMIFERGLDESQEAHLRRLLMDEPFFMIVGTSLRIFPELTDYDRAFFNFFNEVPLDRLNDSQVEELIIKRADFHNNEIFKKNYSSHRPSVRAISRLTGGNPRLITMLYEVLSQREILPVVNLLRQIIDELTPLLKDVLERLPKQQSKVFDALMRKGGTASPNELVEPTRLNLNTITTQLTRLRDAQLVVVQGGGKGRKAYYTVPDQLFCTWYQMRYLRPNRRRIEMIVEFLRVCFDETERLEHLRSITATARNQATNAEYFAASLLGTSHEGFARESVVNSWIRIGQMDEAAYALAEFEPSGRCRSEKNKYAADALGNLGAWLNDHGESKSSEEAYRKALTLDPENIKLQLGLCEILSIGDGEIEAISLCSKVIANSKVNDFEVGLALLLRGFSYWRNGDISDAIRDYTEFVDYVNPQSFSCAFALSCRSEIHMEMRAYDEVIKDCTLVMEIEEVEVDKLHSAFINRGVAKSELGDLIGARDDFNSILNGDNASNENRAKARCYRGDVQVKLEDYSSAIDDYTFTLNQDNSGLMRTAIILWDRGNAKSLLGDYSGAIEDYCLALNEREKSGNTYAGILASRSEAKFELDDYSGAIEDISQALEQNGIFVENIASALGRRALMRECLNEYSAAIVDYNSILSLSDVSAAKKALAHLSIGLVHHYTGDDIASMGYLERTMSDWLICDDDRQDFIKSLILVLESMDQDLANRFMNIIVVLFEGFQDEKLQQEGLVASFTAIASFKNKNMWIEFYRTLESALPSLSEFFNLLQPAARFLETSDISELQRLPADQRTLIESVLDKFLE